MTVIPDEYYREGCKLCCVEDIVYLVGGGTYGDDRSIVTEYNPCTNSWRNMPSLLQQRFRHNVCTVDNKIFVLGGGYDTTCEMLDLSDDNPKWRYIANMNSSHDNGGAVVVQNKMYIVGGVNTTKVEVYDEDQGKLMKYWQTNLIYFHRSMEDCYKFIR